MAALSAVKNQKTQKARQENDIYEKFLRTKIFFSLQARHRGSGCEMSERGKWNCGEYVFLLGLPTLFNWSQSFQQLALGWHSLGGTADSSVQRGWSGTRGKGGEGNFFDSHFLLFVCFHSIKETGCCPNGFLYQYTPYSDGTPAEDARHPDPGRANLRSNFFCEVFYDTMMILRGSLLTQGVTSSSRAWSPWVSSETLMILNLRGSAVFTFWSNLELGERKNEYY